MLRVQRFHVALGNVIPLTRELSRYLEPGSDAVNVEAKPDLSFVREWTRELYADRGRPSIDLVVLFKLQLVIFFEGIRSERTLIKTAFANTPAPWVADPFTPMSPISSTWRKQVDDQPIVPRFTSDDAARADW